MYLETPKGVVDGRNLDAQNLAILRRLSGSSRKPSYNREKALKSVEPLRSRSTSVDRPLPSFELVKVFP